MTAQPLTASPLIWPRALPAPLPRFLLLALLLHVWLVLLLGTAPGGTAPEGQGVFGSLNIILQGAPDGTQGPATPPPLPATPTGAPGEAEQQRFGGAVRSTQPQDLTQPGAAQLGDWSPETGSNPDGQAAGAAPEPAPGGATATPPQLSPPLPQPAPQAPAADGRTAVLGLQRNLPPVVSGETALQRVAPAAAGALPAVPAVPTTVVAAPTRQVNALPMPSAAPQAALRSTPAVAAPEMPVLTAVPLPSAALPAASAERQLTSRLPVERAGGGAAALASVDRAAAGPALASVPALPNRSVAPPPLVPPPASRQQAVPPLPAVTATVSPATLPPLAVPVPSTMAAPQPVPAPAPSAAPLPAPAPVAATVPPAVAEPALSQLPRQAPAALAGGRQAALPSAAAAATAVTTAPLQSPPKPGPVLPNPGQGAPDAGSRVGTDVATLPSSPASAPKRLNLELPRLRGGELSRHSTTGLLPALPRPPEVPDKLGSAIEKTAKEDCRKAYAGAGLLAVVPLAVDALREGGCKW